jgi:hypothetical protein
MFIFQLKKVLEPLVAVGAIAMDPGTGVELVD